MWFRCWKIHIQHFCLVAFFLGHLPLYLFNTYVRLIIRRECSKNFTIWTYLILIRTLWSQACTLPFYRWEKWSIERLTVCLGHMTNMKQLRNWTNVPLVLTCSQLPLLNVLLAPITIFDLWNMEKACRALDRTPCGLSAVPAHAGASRGSRQAQQAVVSA